MDGSLGCSLHHFIIWLTVNLCDRRNAVSDLCDAYSQFIRSFFTRRPPNRLISHPNRCVVRRWSVAPCPKRRASSKYLMRINARTTRVSWLLYWLINTFKFKTSNPNCFCQVMPISRICWKSVKPHRKTSKNKVVCSLFTAKLHAVFNGTIGWWGRMRERVRVYLCENNCHDMFVGPRPRPGAVWSINAKSCTNNVLIYVPSILSLRAHHFTRARAVSTLPEC